MPSHSTECPNDPTRFRTPPSHPPKSAFMMLLMLIEMTNFLLIAKCIFHFPIFAPMRRLFSAASSDSIRFHSNLLSHDNDLRVSIDNTCTDSLVTALDDEALLINDYMNDMSKSKVSRSGIVFYFLIS